MTAKSASDTEPLPSRTYTTSHADGAGAPGPSAPGPSAGTGCSGLARAARAPRPLLLLQLPLAGACAWGALAGEEAQDAAGEGLGERVRVRGSGVCAWERGARWGG